MKFILKSAGYLLLIVCLIILVLLLIPDKQYKSLAEKAIHKFTDRSIVISELKTQRNLNPTIEIKGFSLSNPAWAKKSEMITADQFSASMSLIELTKGKLNLDLSSSTVNLDLIRDSEGNINWQFGTNDSVAEVQKSNENPSLKNLAHFVLKHLNMSNFKLVFDDDQAKAHHELLIDNMEVIESKDGIAQKISATGSLNNLTLSLTGSTGTLSELGNSNKMPIDLQAKLDDLSVALKGNLDAESEQLNLVSDVNLSLPKLDLITNITGQKLPKDWKNISGTTKLLSKAGLYSLENIDIKMDGSLNVNINGSVNDLSQLKGVELNLKAALNSVKELSIFSPDPLPDLGPLEFTGKINSDKDKLSLSTGDLSYSGNYGTATITGDIGDIINVDKVNLKADINLPNLDIVKLFSDAQIPALGNVKLTSDVVSPTALDLSAKNVKLSYDHEGIKVNSSGSINSIIKNGGELSLDVNGSLDSLASLNTFTGAELPSIGPIDLSTKVSGSFAEIRANEIIAEIKDQFLSGSISGDIGAITKLDSIKLNTNLSSPSIGGLFKKLGVDSTATIPAKLAAKFNKTETGIKVDSFSLDMDDNKINGELAVANILGESKRPKLTGEIKVIKFNLDNVLGTKPDQEVTDSAKKSGQALPDSPLPLNYLRDNDLDLTIDITEFETSFITLSNAKIKAIAEHGKFTLGPINTKLNGGDTALEVKIDASTTPANTSINTKIEGFSFKQAGTFKDSSLLDDEGTADASLVLTGTGESVASILASSNGNGIIDIKNLAIKNELIKFVSGDLASEAAAKLNPLDKKSNTTKINCSAVKLEVTDGLLKAVHGYIADAEAFTITGKAQVNLKDQSLDIEVNTNPKEGLGLGLGELAKAIKIQGTIENPKVGLNAEGVAEIGASVGAAIATGGLSILAQGQLEKIKAKSETCAEFLK